MSQFDYQKFGVLYADDDSSALNRFRDEFSSRFRILTAQTTESAFDQLAHDRIGVGLVLCEQTLADSQGVPFLNKAW